MFPGSPYQSNESGLFSISYVREGMRYRGQLATPDGMTNTADQSADDDAGDDDFWLAIPRLALIAH
jgi:hypothetical protein